jgi:hypothetical protein
LSEPVRDISLAPTGPRAYRHAVNAVTCWCVAEASAVEPTGLFHGARAELSSMAGDDRLGLLVDDLDLIGAARASRDFGIHLSVR